jgi:hypothetical protein
MHPIITQQVYYTKSMEDDSALGPIHIIGRDEITLCNKLIDGPRWYYTDKLPTCKKCIQKGINND